MPHYYVTKRKNLHGDSESSCTVSVRLKGKSAPGCLAKLQARCQADVSTLGQVSISEINAIRPATNAVGTHNLCVGMIIQRL